MTNKAWSKQEVSDIFAKPFNDLLFEAQSIHRSHHNPNSIQASTLLSIKTGACPEDCAYCPQSARYDTGLERERLLSLDEVREAARNAKQQGATRFCMGAAWRNPTDKNLETVIEMIKEVQSEQLETCVTLGMLTEKQSKRLADVGLDFYNHNIDTSPEFYGEIITTRDYQDRLDTLKNVRESGIHVCSGGILGMGENRQQRVGLLLELANMDPQPESVPINLLVQIEGTPLYGTDELDPIEFVRMIAATRILIPETYIRLSAGRESMNDAMQALCFHAGANSVFFGEKLLTAPNPDIDEDTRLFDRLGMSLEAQASH
ncbi:MAG: biotin synthase BioB [Gammaproteobacteria bacterium]|nr:biotin synthase BioB [Gammaproteobacteria bacterium]